MKTPNKTIKENLSMIIVILLVLFNFQTSATTYYISNDGLDINVGTSPSSSWQTLDKVNSFVFQPGDSVLFKRNHIWRGQLIPQSGSQGGYIYYGAYGTGNKPCFLGSTDLSNSNSWINKGNNIWSSVSATTTGGEKILNPSFNTDANNWLFYSQGSALVTGARDITDFVSSPASYKINCTSNGDYLYDIQFSTPDLSILYGKTYCLSFKAKCSSPFQMAGVYLMKQITPYNIYFSNTVIPPAIDTSWTSYTIHFTSAVNANDAMINFFFGNSLPDGSTFFIDDISFKEVAFNSAVVTDVGNIIFNNATSFGVKKYLLSDLQIQGDFWYDSDSICVKLFSTSNPGLFYNNIECALTKNIIDEQDKQYIIYENLDLKYGSAHGIGGGNTNHIIVRNCDVSYIGGGLIYIPFYGNVRYGNGIEFWGNTQNNLVEQCKIWEIYDAALTNQNDGTPATQSDIVYRNNLICNAEYSFEYWNRPDTFSVTSNIYFINNTCMYAGKTWAHEQREAWDQRGRHVCIYQNNLNTSNFNILNNIFSFATHEALYVLRYSDLNSFNLNNNCWYQNPCDTLIKICWGSYIVNSYTPGQFADYQSTYQQDSNSFAAYPLFADTINGNYQILFNSPCIDSGTPDTTGIPVGQYDLIGNNRIQDGNGIAPSTIDIGCYEYEYSVGIAHNNYLDGSTVKVYPNPFSETSMFEILSWKNQKYILTIFDMFGREITRYEIHNHKTEISRNDLPNGMYFYQVKDNKNIISTGKLIIQ